MSRSINIVLLSGNLTRNPEHTVTSNGTPRCTFGVATNTTWRDSSGNLQEVTEFHNVVCWNKLADICNQLELKVGMKVFIKGEIRHRSWVDQDGKKQVRDEIKADEIDILTQRARRDEAPSEKVEPKSKVVDEGNVKEEDDAPLDVDDLPF